MLLEYEVLISTSIRRKKPWTKLKWIGIQKESICLMDKNRISILYVPSGRTRKNIGPLKKYMKEVICFRASSSGEYVIGLLSSGAIVRWHKDSQMVHIIPSYPAFNLSYGIGGSKVELFISDDGHNVILLLDLQKVYVWKQVNSIDEGEWFSVDINLKSLSYRESTVDATFFSNLIQGDCCLCTVVCSSGYNLGIGCLFLQWNVEMNTFTSSVSYHEIPLVELNPECKPIRLRGAYLSCLSHDGQVLAVAVNQRQPRQSNIVFINPYTNAAVSTHLKGMGTQNHNVLAKFTKTYWIADLVWSHDDLFVVCISRRGNVFIVSKLGEIQHIKTHGQSVDFGPSLFIPLHPLFECDKKQGILQSHAVPQSHEHPIPRPDSPTSLTSTVLPEKHRSQRFSVSAHPRLPLILCCDGFMVTAMQLVHVVKLSDVVTITLVEANQSMKNIIKDFDLNVKCNITPPLELVPDLLNPSKFKEHRLAVLYSSFKSKFKKNQEVKINKDTEKSGNDSFVRDEEISMLKYRFEDEDEDTKVQSEDKVKENTSAGIILSADEEKIGFNEEPTINNSSDSLLNEPTPVCGKSLYHDLINCVDKILSVWGLFTAQSRSDYLSGDVRTLSDELQVFFLQTIKTICDVIVDSQQLSHCLTWDWNSTINNESQFNLQSLLCDLTNSLADQFINLILFDVSKKTVQVQALKILLKAVISCHRTAGEGCTSAKDISENFNHAFVFLFKAEKYLFIVNSFQATLNKKLIQENDYNHLNVTTLQYDMQTLYIQHLMLPSLWKYFYSVLVKFYEAKIYQQINPLVVRLLNIVQNIVMPRLKPVDNLTVLDETSLHKMLIYLCEYKLDYSLDLAVCELRDNLISVNKSGELNWLVVELLGSVMTSYFTNQPIMLSYINDDERLFIMERNLITSAIRSLRLSYIWTVDRAIDILLCCGRLFEAASFANDIGDWKSSVAIQAVAEKLRAQSHHKSLVMDYNINFVSDILKNKMQALIAYTDVDQMKNLSNLCLSESEMTSFKQLTDCNYEGLYPYFVDIFTVSVMTGCDLTTWFSDFLWKRLKNVCLNLEFLVYENVYLPSPPLYLPLPTPSEIECEYIKIVIFPFIDFFKYVIYLDQSCSYFMRYKISALVQTILVFFHSIKLTEIAVSWYIKKLDKLLNIESNLPLSTLLQSLPNCNNKIDKSKECGVLLSLFRDLMALLWMFHIQEKISFHVRNYQKLRESQESYDETVRECLYWIDKFIPFSKFLNCVDKLNELVLCLCSSLPIDQFSVNILAKYFYDPTNIDAKIESRFNDMMKKLKETNATDDSEHTVGNLQPMSVIYHKKCCLFAKRSKRNKMQHIFVDGNTFEKQKDLKLFLSDCYPFEKDPVFNNFLYQIFEVVLSRSEHLLNKTLNRNPNNQDSLGNNILVLSNRNSIAFAELELENVHQQQIMSKISEKAIYERDHLTSSDDNKDFNFDCPKIKISDAPSHMQKRLQRLFPYLAWLQFWLEKPFPESQLLLSKPSMRIKLTKSQLLQGLIIAEIRFRRNMFLPSCGMISNMTQHETQIVDNQVTTVNPVSKVPSPSKKSDDLISTIKKNDHSSTQVTSEETLLPQVEIDPELSTEELEEEEVENGNMEIEKGSVEESDVKLEMNGSKEKKEIVFLQEEEKESKEKEKDKNEEVNSFEADRDVPEKLRPEIPTESQSNVDIASTVRSEINNVLIAQQVSLLSQILLGQTLGQQPNVDGSVSHNNLVSGVLQSFLPQVPPQNQSNPQKQKSFSKFDDTLPNVTFKQKGYIAPLHSQSQHEVHRLQQKVNSKHTSAFAIPLFHIERIAKPKNFNLVNTPHSNWGLPAQVAFKERSSPVAITSIKQVPKNSSRNTVDKPLLVSELNIKQKNLPSTQSQTHLPKTDLFGDKLPLPILKNTYQRQTKIEKNTTSALLKYPLQSLQQSVPRLINPRMVLAYENKKQLIFQQVKGLSKKGKPPPSVSNIKLLTPFLENRPAVYVDPNKENLDSQQHNVIKENIELSVVEKPPVIVVPKEKTKELPLFDGYISQEEVSREVQFKNNGYNSDMSQASAHYLASVGKQVVKPRMKDVQLQVIIDDSRDHDSSSSTDIEDYHDKLKTKPIKPPPDVFLKLRTELNNLQTNDQSKEIPSGFLHVGDISIDTVMHGINDNSITTAKALDHKPDMTPFVDEYEDNCVKNNNENSQVKSMLNQHIEDMNKVGEVRALSHHRWNSAMDQMSAQLDAINAMACKMDQDFKSSAQLVKVIDTIGETLAPEDVKSLPTKERSLSPVYEYCNIPKKDSSRAPDLNENTMWRTKSTEQRNNSYKKRLQEAYELSSYDYDNKELSRHATNSSLSKESEDIVNYVDDVKIDDITDEQINIDDDKCYETPLSYPHSNKFDTKKTKYQETTSKHNTHIKQILNDEDQTLMIKPWKLRTAKEKEDIRHWMQTKTKQRTIEYQQNIGRLRSHEKQPFQQSTTTTNNKLHKSMRIRENQRRDLQASNAAVRMDQSVKFMQELKGDLKNLKKDKARTSQVSPKRYKQSPLKEANRSMNRNDKRHQFYTPYNKNRLKLSLQEKKTSTLLTASSFEYPSDTSILSTWKLSDDLQHILYGSVDVTKSKKQSRNRVTFESNENVDVESHDSSSNISRNTDSLLELVNWNDVDMMVASAES